MSDERDAPELLVNVSLRLPNTHRSALGQHLAPLVAAAIEAGGATVNFSMQPYDPDEED